MLLLVGLGLHEVFASSPQLQEAMKYGGALYILYLSWMIFRDCGQLNSAAAQRPMGFTGAAFFQWINPKSWVMASVAISTCLPEAFSLADIALYTAVFAAISFPCVGIWAWFGAFIKDLLTSPKMVRSSMPGVLGYLLFQHYRWLYNYRSTNSSAIFEYLHFGFRTSPTQVIQA
ncbi:LysE type translocator [compost metagenome]